MRRVGIIARIDASCYRRVALTSPRTEAVWSLDASRSVRKRCACFINKAVFGVPPPPTPSLSGPSGPAVPSVHSRCWPGAPRRSAWAESRSALVCGGRQDAGGFWHSVSPLHPSPCRGGRSAAASWRLEAQSWIFRSRVGLGGRNKHQGRLLKTVNNL